MTLVLKCIPDARLGAVPENWEVPFTLKSVPADMALGSPVLTVDATPQPADPKPVPAEKAALPFPAVTLTLERVAPIDSGYVFFLSMNVVDPDPSLVSIMPANAYVIDSAGQKIQLVGNYVLQPFEHRVGSTFEFMTQTRPAEGPLTITVENAVAYYAPLYVDPPQATPDEMSFTFEAGDQPQHGQTWNLDSEFTIAGYPLKVTSARAATFADIETPEFYPEGSQGYDFGYQFAVESDPSVKINVWMDIMSESLMCWLSNGASFVPSDSSILFTQLCRDAYPNGLVKVTIGELSVLLENTWQSTWVP
jgi:hypothetical protein